MTKKTILNKKRLIFSEIFSQSISKEPLVVVDAGARGELEEPWKSAGQNVLKIIGFEPDKEECGRLNDLFPERKYIPAALWSEKKKLDIFVTDLPFCSSVYRPNFDSIKKYDQRHWEQRKVASTVSYPSTTLDAETSDKGVHCDFLKIDTQGAEYEILRGASKSLENDVFAVLAETWTTEVYEGQPLSHEVMRLMAEKGFALFDLHVAAAWKRKDGYEFKNSKRQIIGLDLLFFKERFDERYFHNPAKLLKAAAIAEVYGFPDYALELLSQFGPSFPASAEIIDNARRLVILNSKRGGSSLGKRLRSKVESLGGIRRLDYPPLHS